MTRWLQHAKELSHQSRHPHHRMAAVVIKGGQVISKAVNLANWGKHCEKRALRPHRNLRGATIIIVRANGRCSKPCKMCARAIKEADISWVVYTNRNGQTEVVSARELD